MDTKMMEDLKACGSNGYSITLRPADIIEMVRAYAVEVNVHKPIAIIKDISNWVIHEISNLYHVNQVRGVDVADLAMPLDDIKEALYKKAMMSYIRCGV